MQLKSFSLKNIGQYCGQVTFDLSPKGVNGKSRPIILFGGKNGSGKTTFLQAIKLCLYGNLSFGLKLSKKQYDSSLKDFIHKPKSEGIKINDAETKLEFYYTETGEESLYEINRSWTIDSTDNVKEHLTILKNNQPLKEVTKSQWQDFINSIIPLPLSSLFFFDGEQIQNLAESNSHKGLSKAINKLLGLELVEQLRFDLEYLLSEERKKNPQKNGHNEIAEIEKQIIETEKEYDNICLEIGSIKSKAGIIKKDLDEVEVEFKDKGGALSEMRDENLKRQTELETQIGHYKNELKEIAEDIFPFCIVPELMAEVKDQLNRENQIREKKALRRFFKQEMKQHLDLALKEEVFKHVDDSYNPSKRKEIAKNFHSFLENKIFTNDEVKDNGIIHDFSAQQESRFLEIERTIQKQLPERVKKIGEQLKKAESEWQQTLQMVLQAPEEHEIQYLIDRLKELQNKLTNSNTSLKKYSEKQSKLRFQIDELTRAKRKLEAELIKNDKNLRSLELILKSNDLLELYQKRLKDKKISLLESELLECWQRLIRKEEFISHLKIDPNTFEVTLFDKAGMEKSKESLSAGEKQIYAIAMLWSLGRISGRPLPVIIDTPLGRLDSDHRINLVESYFPFAAHQVVILSTDTELDNHYYKMLEPSVSHAYHLKYDGRKKSTKVEEGYFW